jgi:hypothetical protein
MTGMGVELDDRVALVDLGDAGSDSFLPARTRTSALDPSSQSLEVC